MTMEQFSAIKSYLSGAYPKYDVNPAVWYDQLQHLNYEVAMLAVKDHVRASKFPPTIHEVIKRYHDLLDNPQQLPADPVIERMRRDGYFNSPIPEPPNIAERRVQKALRWLYSGIVPNWFKRDYDRYKMAELKGARHAVYLGN